MVNTFEPSRAAAGAPTPDGRPSCRRRPPLTEFDGDLMTATTTTHSTDVLVIGWGLSGLVAAAEAPPRADA
jgi:hypothetical protein